MKLLEVNLPESPEFGLKAAAFKRLGQVVVLAGKNGAGKSRILKWLVKYISDTPFSPWRWTISSVAESGPSVHSEKPLGTKKQIDDLIARVPEPFRQHAHNIWYSVSLSRIEPFKFAFLSPTTPEIRDVRTLTPLEMEQHAEAACASPIDELRKQAIARIQDLQNQWFHARSSDITASQEKRQQAITDYDRLQEIAEALLNTRFDRNLRGHATINGKPIGEAGLSEGQRILLLWTVMLHSQVDHLSQTVIICDEPENHLHPQALLDAIEGVRKALPEVQLWIATHSLPLLSYFDPSSIYWVEEGAVEFAGTKPLKVLRGLLGNDGRIGKLHDFLGLPANLATNRFTAQCLIDPNVSDRGEGDPQTGQIRKLLTGLKAEQSLRILDFGAGRGRLAADLFAACAANDTLSKRIEYFAFEPSNEHREELRQRVNDLHGSETMRVFEDLGTLTSTVGLRCFDVVVLCNVLHEIPIDQWLNYFGSQKRFLDLLDPNGHLLLVEDTLLPVGESPHPGGFLVLESAPLYEFLCCKPEELKRDTAESNSRLQAHLIPAALLDRPTTTSLQQALRQVVKIASERIDDLRTKAPDSTTDTDGNARYRNGREHAFYVHQFTNATRALE